MQLSTADPVVVGAVVAVAVAVAVRVAVVVVVVVRVVVAVRVRVAVAVRVAVVVVVVVGAAVVVAVAIGRLVHFLEDEMSQLDKDIAMIRTSLVQAQAINAADGRLPALTRILDALEEAREVLGYYSQVYPEPKGKEVYTKKAAAFLAKYGDSDE